MKNIAYLAIIVVLVVLGLKYWSPSAAPITGVTPEDVAASIANRVEEVNEGIIVTAKVTRPDEASNEVVVQYVLVVNIDPDLFSIQPTTQAEADKQANAFENLSNSMADTLSLSREYLSTNPTVVGVRVTVIFLDGQVFDGTVDGATLKSIPQGSTVEEWLSFLALSPVTMLPQDIWAALLADPAVQKALERVANQQP